MEAVPNILEFLADMLKQGPFIHAQNAFDILKQEGSRMQDTENALVFHEKICPRIHLPFTERRVRLTRRATDYDINCPVSYRLPEDVFGQVFDVTLQHIDRRMVEGICFRNILLHLVCQDDFKAVALGKSVTQSTYTCEEVNDGVFSCLWHDDSNKKSGTNYSCRTMTFLFFDFVQDAVQFRAHDSCKFARHCIPDLLILAR